MKTKAITSFGLALTLGFGLVAAANAQLAAGSPEDRAFTAIERETNTDTKITLLLDFERQFPQSNVIPEVYLMLAEAYQQKREPAKVVEYGEKVLVLNPEHITALQLVSRTYAVERTNLDKAVQYAQRAVDTIARLKTQPVPPFYTEQNWRQWLDTNEQAAKSQLEYAQSVQRSLGAQ